MEKIKSIRFDVYRAVLMLEDKFDRIYRNTQDKLAEFDSILPDGWTDYKRKSLLAWQRKKEELEEERRNANKFWALGDVIKAAVSGEIPNITMDHAGEKIEIDKTTFSCMGDSSHIVAFQITRLRADSIPAKKKLGRPRTDISLEDDEYIGEFTEVVYDSELNVVAIQSNKYGVGCSTVAKYLNFLRNAYAEMNCDKVPRYLIGRLQPIIDEGMTRRALEANYIRKIRLRCSDENIDSIVPADSQLLGEMSRTIKQKTGVMVDLCLSIKKGEASRALTETDVTEMAKNYVNMMADPSTTEAMKKGAKMEMVIMDSPETAAEAVDLLIPKVNFFVNIVIRERESINCTYLHDLTFSAYRAQEGRLAVLLR